MTRAGGTERLDLEPLTAARSLVGRLCRAGRTVAAHIHPGHVASQRVAHAAGLVPTADMRTARSAGPALRRAALTPQPRLPWIVRQRCPGIWFAGSGL